MNKLTKKGDPNEGLFLLLQKPTYFKHVAII